MSVFRGNVVVIVSRGSFFKQSEGIKILREDGLALTTVNLFNN